MAMDVSWKKRWEIDVETLKRVYRPPIDTTLSSADTDSTLVEEIRKIPGGERIDWCYQCGACTGGCTAALVKPEFNPRNMIKLAREGDWKAIAELGKTVWICTTCYTCIEHCPKDVNPVAVIQAIVNVTAKRTKLVPDDIKRMVQNLLKYGRIAEVNNDLRKDLKLPELPTTVEAEINILKKIGIGRLVE